MDIIVSQLDSGFQVGTHGLLGLFHLLGRHFERRQVYMVELQFVALYGIVATLLNVGQYRGYRLVQLRNIQVRALYDLSPFALFRISDDVH